MVRPVVVITGGASGIGLATAQAYAQKGFRVVIGGRRESALKDALAQMPPQSDVQGRSLDVAQRENVNTFFQWVHDSIGPTDILIQAAGVTSKETKHEMLSPKQWDDLMAINATGAYNCMHARPPLDETTEARASSSISPASQESVLSRWEESPIPQ